MGLALTASSSPYFLYEHQAYKTVHFLNHYCTEWITEFGFWFVAACLASDVGRRRHDNNDLLMTDERFNVIGTTRPPQKANVTLK